VQIGPIRWVRYGRELLPIVDVEKSARVICLPFAQACSSADRAFWDFAAHSAAKLGRDAGQPSGLHDLQR